MAAAFFSALADSSKARPVSAGTQPGERVHPEVVSAMREVGFDLSAARPRLLSAELAGTVSVLVTMGCGETCPVVPGVERVEWSVADPEGQPLNRVREIRDQIRDRVRQLIASRGWSPRG